MQGNTMFPCIRIVRCIVQMRSHNESGGSASTAEIKHLSCMSRGIDS